MSIFYVKIIQVKLFIIIIFRLMCIKSKSIILGEAMDLFICLWFVKMEMQKRVNLQQQCTLSLQSFLIWVKNP